MKRYTLVESYDDRSGVIRVIGPYDTEEAAKEALPGVQDFLVNSGMWDIVPIFDLTGLFR